MNDKVTKILERIAKDRVIQNTPQYMTPRQIERQVEQLRKLNQ